MIKAFFSLTRPQKARILLLVDAALVPLAFGAALALQDAGERAFLSDLHAHLALVVLLMLAAVLFGKHLGLCRVRLKDYHGDVLVQTAAVAALLGALSGLLARLTGSDLPVSFHIVFALSYVVLHFLSRHLLFRLVTEIYRRSPAVTRIAIYGAGRTGMALAAELHKRPDVITYAFLDDNAALDGMTVNGVPVHSGARAAKVVERFKINRVILAMPSVSADKQSFLRKRLETMGVEVQTLPSFAQLHGGDALLNRLMPATPTALLARDPLDAALGGDGGAYRGANVMITGAGGSIGLELCRQMIACRPARLVLFELSELALYNAEAEMRSLAEATGVEVVPVLGSVCDGTLVAQVLARHDIGVVLHAAAYKHVPLVEQNLRAGLANNALGTAVLARAALEAGVARFVLVSSDKAVRPGNLMGASKRMAELIVQDLATRATQTIFSAVRFGNVLGSSGSVIPLFQEQIARGGPVTLTDDRVTRYFMTIQEASRLVLLAGSFAEGGEVFVLDMGQPVRVGDLARRMIVAAGYSVRDAGNPAGDIEIVVTGLRPGEKLHEELMMRRGAQITAHPKIIRVREDHLSEIEMAAILRDLRTAVDGGHEADMLEVVVRAVREYAPQNLPDAALQVQIARAGRRAIHAAEQSAPGARPDHAPNGSSGYPTPHRYRPCGGQTGPQAARSRASSAAFTSAGAQAPAPTRSSVPTIDRT